VIPPYGRRHTLPEDDTSLHAFRFHRAARRPLSLLGVRPANSYVLVDTDVLDVKFGPWRITTLATNVLDAEPTGELSLWRFLRARKTGAERALTFGSHRTGGVRIRFRSAVHRLDDDAPTGHLLLIVTVQDPERLIARLRRGPSAAHRAMSHREGPRG
jgi:hypothetical protein